MAAAAAAEAVTTGRDGGDGSRPPTPPSTSLLPPPRPPSLGGPPGARPPLLSQSQSEGPQPSQSQRSHIRWGSTGGSSITWVAGGDSARASGGGGGGGGRASISSSSGTPTGDSLRPGLLQRAGSFNLGCDVADEWTRADRNRWAYNTYTYTSCVHRYLYQHTQGEGRGALHPAAPGLFYMVRVCPSYHLHACTPPSPTPHPYPNCFRPRRNTTPTTSGRRSSSLLSNPQTRTQTLEELTHIKPPTPGGYRGMMI